MEDYPRNLPEFESRFGDEDACAAYLCALRWPEGFRCPACGCGKPWASGRGLYVCRDCGRQTSAIAGTIFQDTKKPLTLWFRAMWHITSQKYGTNAMGLQRALGLGSYRTAWTWLHKLRVAMVRPGRDRLSGQVQADEAFIGGERQGVRGRGAKGKTLVLVVVEDKGRRIGRIRLARVADATSLSLRAALLEAVEPGSGVCTDGLPSYAGFCTTGYAHKVIRGSSEVGHNALPKVNLVVSLLKRWLLGTYQGAVRPSHLDYYLDEFTFRFNRRTSRSRGKLFYRLVQQAVEMPPVLGNEIRGGKTVG